jgi:hypothetical protein
MLFICGQNNIACRYVSDSFYSTALQGLLHTEDQLNVVQVDETEFKNSTSGITKEEVHAADFRHEQGINTTMAISRHALCLLTLRSMLTVYNFLHMSQKAAVY